MGKKAKAVPVEERDWQTEEDLRTIRRAEEVKTNRRRMAAVRRFAAKEQQALQKVVGGSTVPKPKRKKATVTKPKRKKTTVTKRKGR